jgi:hypothetical protein
MLIGYGYFAGLALTTLLLQSWNQLFGSFTWWWSLVIMIAFVLIAGWRLQRSATLLTQPRLSLAWLPKSFNVYTGVFIAILLLLCIRFIILGIEIIERPLFTWDASMHWATKAKVWFATQHLAPFVDNDTWLAHFGQGVFTDRHPDYPAMISLVQTWMALALGHWHDRLINLPWLGVWVALGFAFWGQTRRLGCDAMTALIATYLLLSLPLLMTQIALPGYADVWLSAAYLLTCMALYHWLDQHDVRQAGLALGALGLCLLIKNEGLLWSLTVLVGLLVAFLSRRRLVIVVSLLIACLVSFIWWLPPTTSIAGHAWQSLELGWYPQALWPVLKSWFVFDNWHLVFWLALLFPLAMMRSVTPWPRALRALGAIVAAASSGVLVLFITTRYAPAAIGQTAVGRMTLQFVPTLFFFITACYQHLFHQSRDHNGAGVNQQ